MNNFLYRLDTKNIRCSIEEKYVDRKSLVSELENLKYSLLKGNRILLVEEELMINLPILKNKYKKDTEVYSLIIDIVNLLK